MNYDFIKSLTAEQKAELKKLLNEDEVKSKYEVMFELWSDGKLQYIQEFINDKLNGKYISWYKNGNKHFEEEYKDGKLNGNCIYWYENGDKQREAEYRDGKKQKDCYWYGNGNRIHIVC